jgi:hypothetical protein
MLLFLFGTITNFGENKVKIFKLVSQQYRAWSDCTNVQADLALYWWQRPKYFLFQRGDKKLAIKKMSLPEVHPEC